jgi:hypothetical protein
MWGLLSGYINYIKIGFAVLVICSAGYLGFHIGNNRYLEYKASVEVIAQKQIAENEAKQKESELINKGVTDAYEARINNIHAMYGRMHNASSGAVSSVPNATLTVNGETHNSVSVAEDCSVTTQQLVSLQDWINQQVGIYGH